MIKLTERLKLIADMIEKGETVVDIGTDHGFLPLFLWGNKISPKVIMADISEGSLDKARQNCIAAHPDMNFDLRLGDGLEVLDYGEVDTVVMAGMGGILISEMLDWDIEKTLSFKKFIFQPRSNCGILRKWLNENGFMIESEHLVREGRRICEVITAIAPKEISSKARPGMSIFEYEFPDSLIEQSNDLTEEYLNTHLASEKNIIANIVKGKGEEAYDDDNYKERMRMISRLNSLIERLRR